MNCLTINAIERKPFLSTNLLDTQAKHEDQDFCWHVVQRVQVSNTSIEFA